ncbi:MAG: hypothetical protein Q8Q42_04535 [Nanoarchaeota archaeon]|nr:hypothetical protein [Nanoarchaeota archaeon]
MSEPQFTETDPAYIIADLNARIRALESKYNILTERLLVINQNMIEEYKKLMKEIRTISSETKKTSLGMSNTQDVIKDVVKEMRIFAKKDEVKILEKYIDMLNILKLVTDEQLEIRLEKFKLKDYPIKTERGD